MISFLQSLDNFCPQQVILGFKNWQRSIFKKKDKRFKILINDINSLKSTKIGTHFARTVLIFFSFLYILFDMCVLLSLVNWAVPLRKMKTVAPFSFLATG